MGWGVLATNEGQSFVRYSSKHMELEVNVCSIKLETKVLRLHNIRVFNNSSCLVNTVKPEKHLT